MKITQVEITKSEKLRLTGVYLGNGDCSNLSCKGCPLWALCVGKCRSIRHKIARQILDNAKVIG
jgi:radical SAM protein with 4Fe4S-binding SPASM domain